MKQVMIGIAVFCLLGPTLRAGVVIETEVKDSRSPGKAETETFYADGEMARMDSRSAGGGADMAVIFRDQTMWFVNHDEKTCQKIDKAGMTQLSSQLDAVMKQLADLPPEQREMMEKMMKGKMPGMAEAPPRRVEKGAVEKIGKYACTLHTLYSAEEKVWEACTADESMGGELAEALGAFRAMSRFTDELRASLKQGPFAAMLETPYNELEKLGGFPVRVRTFNSNGEITRESTLKSITRRDVEATVFAVPPGYKVKDLKDELNRGR